MSKAPQRRPRRSAWWNGRRRREAVQRLLSWALVFAITLPLCGVTAVFAEEPGLCEHHPQHTPECGYIEAVEAAPCGHVHDGNCRFPMRPGDVCSHVHDETCGYVEAREEIPCDKNCGAAQAAPGGEEVPAPADTPEISGAAETEDNQDASGTTDDPDASGTTDDPDASESPEDVNPPAGDAPIVHAPDCAYRPAVEGHPCNHVHTADCGFQPGPDDVCDHVHDEDCGYREAVEGHPCNFVCEICNPPAVEEKRVLSWEWDAGDNEVLLTWDANLGVYALGLPGAGPETPVTRDVLPDLLPAAVSVQLEDGSQETLTLTWDFSAIPEEGAYEGAYTLTPALPEGYALAEDARSMAVRLELGGGETFDILTRYLNSWSYRDAYDHEVTETQVEVFVPQLTNHEEVLELAAGMLPPQIRCWGFSSALDAGLVRKDGEVETPKDAAGNSYPGGIWGRAPLKWHFDDVYAPLEFGKVYTAYASVKAKDGYALIVNSNVAGEQNSSENPRLMSFSFVLRKLDLDSHIETAANPANTTVNLFDYWVEGYGEEPTAPQGDILQKSDWHNRPNADAVGNPLPGETNTAYSTVRNWNKGINRGHLLLFGDGLIHAGLWNKGAGQSTQYGNHHAGMEGIVRNCLQDGYPVVKTEDARESLDDFERVRDFQLAGSEEATLGTAGSGNPYQGTAIQNLSENVLSLWNKNPDSDTESLNYLFDPGISDPYKKSYKDVAGLFQLDDEGYYYYSMRENFAEYDEGGNRFILYDAPATTRTDGTNSIGNFFPFNRGAEVFNGLDADGNLTSSVSPNNNTMNHHLGMTVEVNFRQPAAGMINTGSGSVPMTFEFSGDDDVWVFIDDVLVLDLGGVHSELYGTINFSNGEVLIGRAFDTNGIPANPKDSSYLVTQTSLKALFEKAKKGDSVSWRDNTFSSDSDHTLKMFYLERGNYDSSLALRFNLQPQLFQNIRKVDQNGAPISGVEFELYKAEPAGAGSTGAIECLYTDKDVNGKKPFYMKRTGERLATVVTGGDGMAQFVDKDTGEPFNFADIQGTQYFVLHESKTPPGYRSMPVDVVLYYDKTYSMLSVANRWSTGAYACSISSIMGTANLTYGAFKGGDDGEIVPGGSAVSSQTQEDGLVLAIPMLKQQSKGTWEALYGSNLSGFQASAVEKNAEVGAWRAAVLTAALEQTVQSLENGAAEWHLTWDSANHRLTGTLNDLPGLASRYRLYDSTGDMQMVYGVIEPAALTALGIHGGDAAARYRALGEYVRQYGAEAALGIIQGVSVENTGSGQGFSFLNTSQFNRNFRSLIYIPNEQRELWVMKVDEKGVPQSGAEFGLFTDEACTALAASGTTDSEGRLIFSPRPKSDGNAHIEWASSQRTHYYLKETRAPGGLNPNNTVIPVVVGTYSIYADAGTENDDVSVMAGVGRLTQTMRQYASDGKVDITLRDITAYGQTQPSGSKDVPADQWTDILLAGTQVKRAMNLHYQKNALVDYGLHDQDGGKIYKPLFITDTGFIRARVEQNYSALTGENSPYESSNADTNKDDLSGIDLTSLFSLLNVVVVTDRSPSAVDTGELSIRKTVLEANSDGDYTQNFSFKVELTDASGTPLPGEFAYYFWGRDRSGTLTSGQTILLHHDDQITIQGLPAGTRYTVTEILPAGEAWHTCPDPAVISGTVEGQAVRFAHFINSREPIPEQPETGTLTIRKTVTGTAADTDRVFTFRITLPAPGTYSYSGSFSGTITIDAGTNSGTIGLKHGQSVTIEGLPAGIAYKVEETDPGDYSVTSSGGEGTIQADQNATAAFINHKGPSESSTGALTIRKTVTGTAGDKTRDFTFTVVIRLSSGELFKEETFTLRDGQSRTFSDLPAGAVYTVTETDAEGYTVTSAGANGTIPAGGTAAAAFTNSKDGGNPGDPTNPPKDPEDPPKDPEDPPKDPEDPPKDPEDPPKDPENPPKDPEDPPKNPEEPPVTPPPENPPETPPDNPPPENPPETPETPEYPTELPDPNDPNAPDTITILEDGVPTTYVRVWDPEKEEWVWIPEDEVPLDTHDLPKTGDSGLWAALFLLSLAGLGTLKSAELRRKRHGQR